MTAKLSKSSGPGSGPSCNGGLALAGTARLLLVVPTFLSTEPWVEGTALESETARNAQEWFRLMVETSLAPGLRELGFFGAGRRFRMAFDGHWAEVVIAQGRSHFPETVRFTLQLSVISRNEWTEQLRVRPYYPANDLGATQRIGWQAPIGALVIVADNPIGELWWELTIGQPFEPLAEEALTALRNFGIPALRAQVRQAG